MGSSEIIRCTMVASRTKIILEIDILFIVSFHAGIKRKTDANRNYCTQIEMTTDSRDGSKYFVLSLKNREVVVLIIAYSAHVA